MGRRSRADLTRRCGTTSAHVKRRTFLLRSALGLSALALGSVFWTTRWRYIVVHHSADSYGDIDFLQRVHRERQAGDPIDAVPYHFLIGNGNGLGIGEVASDWRQSWGLRGGHVSGRNSVHNFLGVGICLIGNFKRETVPPRNFRGCHFRTRRPAQHPAKIASRQSKGLAVRMIQAARQGRRSRVRIAR